METARIPICRFFKSRRPAYLLVRYMVHQARPRYSLSLNAGAILWRNPIEWVSGAHVPPLENWLWCSITQI